MRCAYQVVVAVVPGRVAAFETGARVISATRLKERDVMNFNNLVSYLRAKLLRNDSGQDLLEYGLLMALIAIFAMGAVSVVGNTVNTVFWQSIATNF